MSLFSFWVTCPKSYENFPVDPLPSFICPLPLTWLPGLSILGMSLACPGAQSPPPCFSKSGLLASDGASQREFHRLRVFRLA